MKSRTQRVKTTTIILSENDSFGPYAWIKVKLPLNEVKKRIGKAIPVPDRIPDATTQLIKRTA